MDFSSQSINSRTTKVYRLIIRLWIILISTVKQLIQNHTEFPTTPNSILVLHSLLLGDTLLLTQLLSKIRQQHPNATITLTVPRPLLPIYKGCPYNINPIAFHPKHLHDLIKILRSGPYDLVIIPAENKFTLLARALGSKHTVAFTDDRPLWKNWMIDTAITFPSNILPIGDIFSTLIPGDPPNTYVPSLWKPPICTNPPTLNNASIIMHITSSVMTKTLPSTSWLKLAHMIKSINLLPYWSIAPGEEDIINRIDPKHEFPFLAINFSCMWHALLQARILISVDTSMVHLARLIGTPNLTIYGPTDPVLFGKDNFLRHSDSEYIWDKTVSCRNDNHLYRRPLSWVKICTKNIDKCNDPICTRGIDPDDVFKKACMMLKKENLVKIP